MWKNTIEPGRPQKTIWRRSIVCWIPEARNTVGICNTYCPSTAAVIARTRLSVTLIRKLPVFLVIDSGLKGTIKVNMYSFLILFLNFIYSPSVPIGRLDHYSVIRVSERDIMDTNIETAQSP
jgi:hypothetical protein